MTPFSARLGRGRCVIQLSESALKRALGSGLWSLGRQRPERYCPFLGCPRFPWQGDKVLRFLAFSLGPRIFCSVLADAGLFRRLRESVGHGSNGFLVGKLSAVSYQRSA